MTGKDKDSVFMSDPVSGDFVSPDQRAEIEVLLSRHFGARVENLDYTIRGRLSAARYRALESVEPPLFRRLLPAVSAAVVFVALFVSARLFFSESVQQDFDAADQGVKHRAGQLLNDSNPLNVVNNKELNTKYQQLPGMTRTNLRAQFERFHSLSDKEKRRLRKLSSNFQERFEKP